MYLSWEIHWWPQISHLNQSKTKQNQTKTKNIDKTMVLAIFWPKVTCCLTKSMYSSWGIQWRPQISRLNQFRLNQTKLK